jgi:hypothetical protein
MAISQSIFADILYQQMVLYREEQANALSQWRLSDQNCTDDRGGHANQPVAIRRYPPPPLIGKTALTKPNKPSESHTYREQR